jgi:hypothetical protein
MNANQVVIVMDRDGAEMIERVTAGALIGSPTRAVNAPIRAALDRDPDLETLISQAIADSMGGFAEEHASDFVPEARAVLAVLGEEGTK